MEASKEVSTKRQREIEQTVNDVLRECERARNSDTFLILKVAERSGQDIKVKRNILTGKKLVVWTMEIERMPSFESITRARRKIQASGLYLPTDEHVRRLRRVNEQRMRAYARGA